MRNRFTWKRRNFMAVLTVAVSVMVALPILLVPIGLGSGAPAYILVDRAYAATYPADPNKKTVLIENYAISAGSQTNSITGQETTSLDTQTSSSGSTVTGTPSDAAGTPTEGAAPTPAVQAADVTPSADDPNAGLIVIGEGQTVSATYLKGETPTISSDPYS